MLQYDEKSFLLLHLSFLMSLYVYVVVIALVALDHLADRVLINAQPHFHSYL